jgi:hypothetical protein
LRYREERLFFADLDDGFPMSLESQTLKAKFSVDAAENGRAA